MNLKTRIYNACHYLAKKRPDRYILKGDIEYFIFKEKINKIKTDGIFKLELWRTRIDSSLIDINKGEFDNVFNDSDHTL